LSESKETLEVVLLGKRDCHLCEIVEAEIQSMKLVKTSLNKMSIDDNESLYGKYWLRVPVVMVGGQVIFEAKLMDLEGRWKKQLFSALRVHGGSEAPTAHGLQPTCSLGSTS
jgi:hypothetical protein